MATRGHSDDPVRIKNEIIEHEVWIMLLLIFFFTDCALLGLSVCPIDWLTDWLTERITEKLGLRRLTTEIRT